MDAAPPMQVSASVQGLSLVLVYDEPLDPASMPATGAYTVTATVGVTTTTPAVSEVSIYGIWVTLTLDAAPAAGATVTLAYAPPASNLVQDEAGNDAPAFSGQSVRLGPPPPPPDLEQVTGVGVAPGNAQLVVTWTAVDNATGYTVQWKSGGQGYNTTNRQATVTSGTTTSHTITGLANGTEYTVQVSATRTGANDGPPSDEMTGTPTVPTAAGITVSTAALTVTEQDSTGDGYTVVLDTEPTADVVVTVAGHVGTDVTANPTALTFTMSNWETAQTVTVTADDDADTTDDSVALTHSAASADSGYRGITIAGVAVTVNDNDTAQVLGVGVVPGNAQLVVTWTAVEPPVETSTCSADAETWRGLKVCDERPRDGYDRDAFGTSYSSLEGEIIAAFPPTMKANGQVYTPYSCLAFDITPDGTAATDIEHIVALAETHDKASPPDRRRDIASDLDNLTIADPTVTRSEKSDRDAAEWMPARHGAWFAERVIQVTLEYGLSVDPFLENPAPPSPVHAGDGLVGQEARATVAAELPCTNRRPSARRLTADPSR